MLHPSSAVSTNSRIAFSIFPATLRRQRAREAFSRAEARDGLQPAGPRWIGLATSKVNEANPTGSRWGQISPWGS